MTIHFDEKSPHAHFACVPIIGDEENGYTLSAKKVLGGQQDYIKRQDRFHREFFSKYGLARGDSKQDTNREHIEQNRYKVNQTKQELLKAQKDTQTQKAISQDLMIELSEAYEQLHELHNEIDRTKSTKRELQAQRSNLYNDLLQEQILIFLFVYTGAIHTLPQKCTEPGKEALLFFTASHFLRWLMCRQDKNFNCLA